MLRALLKTVCEAVCRIKAIGPLAVAVIVIINHTDGNYLVFRPAEHSQETDTMQDRHV